MARLEQQLRHDLEHARNQLGKIRQDIGELLATEDRLEWQVLYISRLLNKGKGKSEEGVDLAEEEAEVVLPTLTAAQAIESVLRKHGKTMRVTEIVKNAIENGYGGPDADPQKVFANFSSVLARAVKRKDSIFRKVGRGIFGLNLPSVAPD